MFLSFFIKSISSDERKRNKRIYSNHFQFRSHPDDDYVEVQFEAQNLTFFNLKVIHHFLKPLTHRVWLVIMHENLTENWVSFAMLFGRRNEFVLRRPAKHVQNVIDVRCMNCILYVTIQKQFSLLLMASFYP